MRVSGYKIRGWRRVPWETDLGRDGRDLVTDANRLYAPGASFHEGTRAADADRERAVDVLWAGSPRAA